MSDVLDYYLHDGPSEFRIQLAGSINDEAARRLEQVWRTAGSLIGDRRPIVDITLVRSVDEQGSALLLDWHQAGARIIANSEASRALAESILGAALLEPAANIRRWRWPLRVAFFKSTAATVPWLATLLFIFAANAAS
jgi:hypothetical protein